MQLISQNLKANLILKVYSLINLPLIAFAGPKVVELSLKKITLEIPLGYRTKNHLGVMYFGALCMGAEATIALTAVKKIFEEKLPIDFLFKDFKANFIKKAAGDVHFVCDQAEEVAEVINMAANSDERITKTFKSYAIVPSISQEIIAEFEVTLTCRKRKSKTLTNS